MKKFYPLLAAILFLCSCSTIRTSPAPIIDGTSQTPPPAPTTTSTSTAPVAPVATAPAAGNSASPVADTTSSSTIAKANDDDEGTVVSSGNAKPSGQTPASSDNQAQAAAKPAAAVATVAATTTVIIGGLDWQAPTKGKIVQPYNLTTKGVDVQGKEGQTIVAAADGKVAYSGNGLKGYGNLVIIKHDEGYLTAYSHNKVNVVKEGDTVKRGQKIAELGRTESDKPILHFELRKSGKPVDPTLIFK